MITLFMKTMKIRSILGYLKEQCHDVSSHLYYIQTSKIQKKNFNIITFLRLKNKHLRRTNKPKMTEKATEKATNKLSQRGNSKSFYSTLHTCSGEWQFFEDAN